MKPFDFYSLAKCLNSHFKNKDDFLYPAAARTCVSRAYYSAYLSARSASGEEFKMSKTSHADLINHYNDLGDPQLSNAIKELKTWRQDADYEMDISCGNREVERAIHCCQKIFQYLKKYQPVNKSANH